MRGYDISRKPGEWWKCKVRDSYGRESVNWFETQEECNKQVLYTWESEKSPKDRLRAFNEAIRKMVDRDESKGKLY